MVIHQCNFRMVLKTCSTLATLLQAPEKLLPWVMGLQREVMEIEMALQQHDVMIETLEGRSSGQRQSFIHKVPGKHIHISISVILLEKQMLPRNLGENRLQLMFCSCFFGRSWNFPFYFRQNSAGG